MFAPRLSYSYLLGLIGFGILHVAAQDQTEPLIPVKATYNLAKFPENMQKAFKFGLRYPDEKFPIGCVMVIQHNDTVTVSAFTTIFVKGKINSQNRVLQWEQLLNAEHYFPFCLPAVEQPLSFQAVSPKTLHDLDVMVLEKPEPQWGQHFYALSGAWPSTGSLSLTSASEKNGWEKSVN